MELDVFNWMFVFMRISAYLLVLPFFSVVNFPTVMRIALAAFSALLVAPMLPHADFGRLDLFSICGLMFREVSIGLALGFVSRMIFYAVDLAGNIVSMEMGLNLPASMNPLNNQNTQAPGMILFLLASVTMLTLDLHHWILMGFERTYSILPVGGGHLNAALFESIVAQTNQIFMIALQIAAPMIAVSFVVTMVFTMLSRAVPQMNVFMESFGFRIAGGLIVFGFTLQLTAIHVMNYLRRLPDDLLVVAQMIAGG